MTDAEFQSRREAKCRAKQRFRSAQQAKLGQRYQEIRLGITLFVYKCDICHGHHLTHTDPKDRDLAIFTRAVKQAFHGGHLTREEMETAIREYERKLKT